MSLHPFDREDTDRRFTAEPDEQLVERLDARDRLDDFTPALEECPFDYALVGLARTFLDEARS